MTADEMIRHDYRQSGAYRIVRMLANSPEFSAEVQQKIRLQGILLVDTPEFEARDGEEQAHG